MPSSPDHCDILTIPIIILIPIIVYLYCDCEEIWANLWSLQYFFFFSFFLVLRYIESFLIIFNHFWSLCSSLSLFILTVIVRRSGPISDCNSSHLSRSSSSPKPAYGRQGLARSWGQNTDEVSTFLLFLMSHFAPPALSSDWNQPGTINDEKNPPRIMKNRPGAIKTDL